MEASQFSSSKESLLYTMCCEGDVHCGIWHWCISKTDGKRWLLLHVLATSPLSSAQEKMMSLGGTEPHHSLWQCKESHHCCCTDLLWCWQWEILEHQPYSPNMSPCDYNLFAKVKKPLLGIRYNTRHDLNRAIGWSLWNINKDGHADGFRRLQNIWQKVINQGATISKVHKCQPCE